MTAVHTSSLETWLHQPWPANLIAVGGCDASDTPFFQPLSAEGKLEIKDDCWQILNETIVQLAAHGCGETESLWVFESALLWIARRADGAWATVISPRELTEGTVAFIKDQLGEFVAQGSKRITLT